MLFVACLAYASVLSVPASLAQAATARSGTLEAVVTDNPRTGHSITRYTLKSGRKRVPVQPTELAAEPGDRVTVTGKFRDGRLVGAVEATSPSAQAVTPGPRKAAVLLVTFPGDPAEPWSPATSRSEVFTAANSASAFYAEESYGEVSLTGKLNADGDVFGWLSLDTPTAGCPWSTWKDKADEAASDAGIDLSGYRHVIYEFQWQSSCSWLGKAALGGGWAMINGNLFGFRHRVTVHELGHNLGLLHAGSWRCTADGVRVQISDTCTVGEYGDPFDAMGNIATRHNNGWNLAKLGFLAPENVETVSGSGNYSIRSALSPTAEPTVLRTPRKRDLDGKIASWYYLEVRKTGGVFENVSDASTEGVSIRATAAKSSAETLLLDANPSTSTFQDAPLGAEQTFDGGPVQIETLTAGGGSATVSIELDEEPPSAPPGLAATPGFEKVQLQWDASADDFGVGRYVVFRDGVEVGASASTGFTDSPVALGEHTYVVYAEDETGNQSAASGAVAVTVVPDEEPPTAPTGLTAAAVADGVQLQWGASADDFGVDRYRVFRDGDSIGVPAGTSFLDSLVSAGEHTYVVYAEDETGNQSAASAPATVAVPAISGPVCAGGSCRVTFRYSGVAATWTVPPGVGKAEFTVAGARGSGPGINLGARVVATLGSLTPEEDVTVSVGGMGQPYSEGGAGGFNGGGDGALGGGGGGYSSVALGDPLTLMLLAGGGGGEGGEGFNAVTEQEPRGGWGGQGGEVGTGGSFLGRATEAHGATLGGGEGGAPGGSFDPPFTDGAGGAGGEVTGTSSCAGGAFVGAPGDSGESLEGGGGTPDAGGGGGGGYFGGGQGGAGAGDACGSRAGAGGGGGGSSYADGELSAEFDGGVRSSDGEVSIAYANPIGAVAHSYTTTPDQELVVPADSGVLAGATAPGGDPLSASVESGPAHGELTLDGDGSLTYTPAPEYAGNDSFSYRAAGPSGNYATAQATLTIAEPPSASISAPADGATYALGQTVEAGFSCAEGEGGPGVSSCTGTVADGEPLDTSAAGSHTFTATATSEDGLTDQASSTYTVEAPAPPPSPASESEPAPPVPVPPPPPSISIGGGFAPVAQRSTRLWLGCEGPAGTVCRGRLLLRTRGRIALRRRPAYKRAIVLGRTRYAIPAGETRPVGVRLEKVALRLLKRTRHNRLRITATAAGRPGANRTAVLAPNRELRRVLVRYRRSGGFAGSSAGLVVARNGSARSGTSRTRLNRRVRARLGRALRRARFASLESNYEPAVPIADAFTHLIAYRGRTIRAVDTAAPPRLQAVIEILGQVLATLRAEQRNP